MKLTILGTEYTLVTGTEQDFPYLKDNDGFCDTSVKTIVVADMSDSVGKPDSLRNLTAYMRKVAMHECVHAFLYESGLSVNSDWALNEELVDWIAIQLPKLCEVYAQLVQLKVGDK